MRSIGSQRLVGARVGSLLPAGLAKIPEWYCAKKHSYMAIFSTEKILDLVFINGWGLHETSLYYFLNP